MSDEAEKHMLIVCGVIISVMVGIAFIGAAAGIWP